MTLDAVTSWTDEGVERGRTYYYTVVPINSVGEGEPYAAFEVKVQAEEHSSPGFGAMALITVILLMLPFLKRRR